MRAILFAVLLLPTAVSAQTLEQRIDALEQRMDAMEAHTSHPPVAPPTNFPPTASNLSALCQEGSTCVGNIGTSDPEGDPVDVSWGLTSLDFTGQDTGSWSVSPIDGDDGIHNIPFQLSDGTSIVDLMLTLTIEDTIDPPPPPTGPPSPVVGTDLADCVDQLMSQGGGWCSMGPDVSTAYPSSGSEFGDPSGAIEAWVGWAVDTVGLDVYLVAGGGHTDYRGNEVIRLDLETGTYETIHARCPLDLTINSSNEPYGSLNQGSGDIPDPLCGPAAAHTYDGVIYSSVTGTIWFQSKIYALSANVFTPTGEIWEFNPGPGIRNGMSVGEWRMWDLNANAAATNGPVMTELSDGSIVINSNSFNRAKSFDPQDPLGTITSIPGLNNDYGYGNALSLGDTTYFVSALYGIFETPLGQQGSVIEPDGPFGTGADFDSEGRMIIWDGQDGIDQFDPQTGELLSIDWSGSKVSEGVSGRTYSKWTYLPSHDVFVGISAFNMPVQVYKHIPALAQ